MMNASLNGKPYAGNPHVRFDEGEVASAKPRRGSLLYTTKTVKVALAAACAVALCDASAAVVTRSWDGDASGNWSVAENWTDDTKPAKDEKALLPSVSSGTRTVTVDEAPWIDGLVVQQENADAVNKIVLEADLVVSNRTVDYKNSYVGIDASSVATNAVQVDLNGRHVIVAGNGTETAARFGGTWTMGPGSVFDLMSLHGNQNGLYFENNGLLEQQDSTINWLMYPDNYGTTSNHRGWVNNGTWIMDGANYAVDILINGTTHYTPGGFGYAAKCENFGTLLMLNASTNICQNPNNYGHLTLSGGSGIGSPEGYVSFYNYENASLVVTNEGTVLAANSNNTGSFFKNFGGTVQVGDAEGTPTRFLVAAAHMTMSNCVDGVFSVHSNATVDLKFSMNSSVTGIFGNDGTFEMDNGRFIVDYCAPTQGNQTEKWGNSGTWTMDHGSLFAVTSSTGRAIWGYAVDGDANNMGTMRILNGSRFGFGVIHNYGPLELGENARHCLVYSLSGTHTLKNHDEINITGTNVVWGHPAICYEAKGYGKYTFEQSKAAGSDKEPIIRIGTNDTDKASLTIGGGKGAEVVLKDGQMVVSANARFAFLSTATNGGNDGAIACLTITNGASLVQRGDMAARSDGYNYTDVKNYANWTVDSTVRGSALKFTLLPPASVWGPRFWMYAGSTFFGRGHLVYENLTSSANMSKPEFHSRGDFVVGPGGFEMTSFRVLFDGSEPKRMVFDVGSDPAAFGGLTVSGDVGEMRVNEGTSVVLRFPKDRSAWMNGWQTLRLVTYQGAKINNNPGITTAGFVNTSNQRQKIASFVAENANGTPATDVQLGEPAYGENYLEIPVKVVSRGLMLLLM